MQSDEIIALAERSGNVLLLPGEFPTRGTWTGGDDAKRVIQQVVLAGSELCLDLSGYFVLGLGNGGEAAMKVAERDTPTAAVSYAYRQRDSDRLDELNAPLMFVSILRDPTAPADGKGSCGPLPDERLSVEAQETKLLKSHKCRAPKEFTTDQPGLECRQYDCASGVVLCTHDSARFWPGMYPNNPLAEMCSKEGAGLSDFVWSWFESFVAKE